MRRPCPTVLNGCPGVDAPITNISAEAPDPLLFAAQIFDPYNPYDPPPLGNGPNVDVDCQATIGSLTAIYNPIVYAGTQLMADLQALAIQLGCPWPTTGDQVYGNDEQSYTLYCADGSSFTYTVEANTMVSPPLDPVLGAAFVAFANAWALSYAFDQASALLDCGSGEPEIPGEPPGDTPPTFPSGPGILNNPSWMCFGEEYFDRYTIAGARNSAYTIEVISGAIPPGTTFNQTGPREATISGTPTAPGQYTWTIRAISSSLPTTTVQFTDSLWVMGITNWDALPDADAGMPYGPEQLTSAGGTAPYTFSSDDLPEGFYLGDDGTLTSDATTIAGAYTFTVTITDANGGTCDQDVDISVVTACVPDTGPPPPLSQPAFISDTIQIDNWSIEKLGLVAPTADPAGVQPEWNGIFPVRDLTTVPGWVFYLPTGSAPPIYVALSFNGILGDTGGILLYQGGGAGPWILDFLGFVGGVPTIIWEGEKAVGSCAAGTYMQTAGIATGPQCFHVGGECTTPLAWWPMATFNANLYTPDVANGGLILANVAGPNITQIAGKVGAFAIRIHNFGFTSFYAYYQGAEIAAFTNGLTIALWVSVTYNVSDVNNAASIILEFYVGGVYHDIVVGVFEGGSWAANFDGGGTINKAFAAGWHFLVITYNPSSGTFGFDIDQSGITTSVVAALTPSPDPATRLIVGGSTQGAGDIYTDYDEIAVYGSVLTQEQLDWIYNSGAGRTYPI